MSDPVSGPARWSEAWIDGLAFAGGLGLAWFFKWKTADLVWSLWLSSFVVGYTAIVWMILRAILYRQRSEGRARSWFGWTAGLGGSLFLLGFFTVHYGGFHLGHSVFLNMFFPLNGAERGHGDFPSPLLYAQVLVNYGWFLPVAFLAERQIFRPKEGESFNPMAPYKNVVRMHLLIFFFAFTSMAGFESFFTYVVVYAVYFFPWRLLARKKSETPD